MRQIWLALVSMCAVGCAPKVHPLQSQRELLAQLERQPLEEGWAPQATIAVGEPMVERVADQGLDQLLDEIPDTVGVPVPLVGKIPVHIQLERPDAVLSPGACEDCVQADATWSGQLQLGSEGTSLPWTAATTTTAQLRVVDGQRVELVARPDAPNDVTVDLPGVPKAYRRALNAVVEQVARAQLTQGALSRPFPVVVLPPEQGIRLRDLRLQVEPEVRVDLAFAALTTGEVEELPDPGDGFAMVVPEETLLGVLQASAARREMVRGFAVEPTSLAVDDDRFQLELRVWRAGRNERYRAYRVRGRVALEERGGRVVLRSEESEEIGGVGGGFGLMGGYVRNRVEAFLADGVSFPAQRRLQVGEEVWTLAVRGIEADDGRIVVRGDLRAADGRPLTTSQR